MYLKSYSLCNAGEANYTKEKFSRGGKIFFAFLLIVYIIPLFANLIIDTQPIFRLPIQSSPILFSILLLISVSIIALIIGSISTPIIPKNVGPIKPLPKSIIVIFSIITISVGINILLSGLTQWRYTTSISSSNLVLFASVIQILMPSMGFWVLMTDHRLILSRSSGDIIVKLIMLLGIISSINGYGSMPTTLLFILLFIAPNAIIGFLFSNTSYKKKNFLKYLTLPVIIFFLIPTLFAMGAFAKSGNRTTVDEIFKHYSSVNYMINRHSIHLSSLAASIEDGPEFSNISIPFKTAAFRFKKFTGIDSEAKKPDISSFSRLALIQFSNLERINPKGGSSPGLIATLTMIMPLPLAVIGLFFVTFFLVKLIDFIMCRQPPFSWIGALIFAYIPLKNVTDSPLDLLIPGPITIVLLFVILLSLRREKVEQ